MREERVEIDGYREGDRKGTKRARETVRQSQ